MNDQITIWHANLERIFPECTVLRKHKIGGWKALGLTTEDETKSDRYLPDLLLVEESEHAKTKRIAVYFEMAMYSDSRLKDNLMHALACPNIDGILFFTTEEKLKLIDKLLSKHRTLKVHQKKFHEFETSIAYAFHNDWLCGLNPQLITYGMKLMHYREWQSSLKGRIES